MLQTRLPPSHPENQRRSLRKSLHLSPTPSACLLKSSINFLQSFDLSYFLQIHKQNIHMDFSIVSRTNLVSPSLSINRKVKKKTTFPHFPPTTRITNNSLHTQKLRFQLISLTTTIIALSLSFSISISIYVYLCLSLSLSCTLSRTLFLFVLLLSTFVLYLHFCLWPSGARP